MWWPNITQKKIHNVEQYLEYLRQLADRNIIDSYNDENIRNNIFYDIYNIMKK